MAQKLKRAILDPVDVVTGECTLDRTDFSLPGPIPIEWRSSYSSRSKINGPLGWGWTHPYYQYIIFVNNKITYINGEGGEISFSSIPAIGETIHSLDERYSLQRNGEHSFQLIQQDGSVLSFRGAPAEGYVLLEKISNLNGQSIQFFYRQKHLIKIVDSASRILDFEINHEGRILKIDCSRGNSGSLTLVSYQYDHSGNLIAVTDAENHTQSYEYDQHHQLLKRTDRNGYSFHYQYSNHFCIKTWGDDGLYSGEFIYFPNERRTIYIGFDGRRFEYRYNEKGQLTEEIDPYGRVTATQYDAFGNPAVIIDRCDRRRIYKYDERGNLLEEVDPLGRKTSYRYNARNQLIEKVDFRGQKTTFEYDDRGNLIKEILPDGRVNSYEYDGEGHRTFTRVSGSLPEKNEYDSYHQLTTIRDPFTRQELYRYQYDLLGNVIAVWDKTGWIRYRYDKMSRIMEALYPDGTTEKNTYDPEGNITSYTDRLGRTWQYRYKARKEMIEMMAPDGGVTQYDYTRADEMCLVIDPNGNQTEFLYDQNDQIIGVKQNQSLLESYLRDGEGRLLEKRDSQGNLLVSYAYEMGEEPCTRIIQRVDKKIESHFTFDRWGQIIKAKNDFAEVRREYHPFGYIASETINGLGVTHEFNAQGQSEKTRFNDGIEFRLKHYGDVIVCRDPTGGWHTLYLENNKVIKRALANGIEESIEYDKDGRVIRHRVEKEEGLHRYLERNYSYDVLGQLIRLKEGKEEQHFLYDECGRLIKIVQIGDLPNLKWDKEVYTYDKGGNLLSTKEITNAIIGKGNQLLHWGNRHFSYDERGRLSRETRVNGNFNYHYDSSDQLISIDLPDGKTVTYEYDPFGRRISKKIGDEKTTFGWEGNRLSWEIGPDGKKRYYFYLFPEDYIPTLFCDHFQTSDGEWSLETYFVHYDQSSRPILITDSEGEIAWSAEYTAYGKAKIKPDSKIVYNLRAPGQYEDAETGLHYNYHRYYDPETGRYITPDPIGLKGGLNLYGYGEGNPLATCDVLGLANK